MMADNKEATFRRDLAQIKNSKLGLFLKKNEDLSLNSIVLPDVEPKEKMVHTVRTGNKKLSAKCLAGVTNDPKDSKNSNRSRSISSHCPMKLVASELLESVLQPNSAKKHKPTNSSLNTSSCIEINGIRRSADSDRYSMRQQTSGQVQGQQLRTSRAEEQQDRSRTPAAQESNSSPQDDSIDFALKRGSWVGEKHAATSKSDNQRLGRIFSTRVAAAVRRNVTNFEEEQNLTHAGPKIHMPNNLPAEKQQINKKQLPFHGLVAKKTAAVSANLTPTKSRTDILYQPTQMQPVNLSVVEPGQRDQELLSKCTLQGIWAQSAQGSKRKLERFAHTQLSERRSHSSKSKSHSNYPGVHVESGDETALLLRAKKAELVILKKKMAQMASEKNKFERELLEVSQSRQAIMFELEESKQQAQELQQIVDLRNSELNKLLSQLETMQRLVDHQMGPGSAFKTSNLNIFNPNNSIMSQVQDSGGYTRYQLDVPEYGIAIIEESCGEESDKSETSQRKARGGLENSDLFNVGARLGKVANSVRRKLKELFGTKKTPTPGWLEQLLDVIVQSGKTHGSEGTNRGLLFSMSGKISRPHSGRVTPQGGESAVADFEDDFTEEDFSIYHKSKQMFCGGNPFTPSKPSTPKSNKNISDAGPGEQDPPIVRSSQQEADSSSSLKPLVMVLLQILQHKYFENESLYGLTRWLQSQIKRYKHKLGDCKSRQREAERLMHSYQQVLLEGSRDADHTPIPELFSPVTSSASLQNSSTRKQAQTQKKSQLDSIGTVDGELLQLDDEPVMGTNYLGEIEWRNDDTIIYQ
jgi:hypothetical protein